MRATLHGEMTWTVDFDADAEAAGHTDCSYTREYTGTEDLSAPWLCGECDLLFQADVELIAGRTECFDQVSPNDPAPSEWMGFNDDHYFRNGRIQGTADVGDSITTEHFVDEVPAQNGGLLSFTIDAEFHVGDETGDVMHGVEIADAYDCGWPKADPAPYTGDYTLAIGETLPDGWFRDICGDTVRLHDFFGRYLVVDISAMDCPPCRTMAQQEGAFVEAMADEGIEVEVITLLAPSLSDTSGTPTDEQLQSWIDDYDLHSPVLADQVWAISVASPALGEDYAYPTSILVRPDGTVMEWRTGFSSFDPFAEAFRADAE